MSGSSQLRSSWILMLIVGLIPFSYGVSFVIAYAISAVSGNASVLSAVEPVSNVNVFKEDFTTLFWGSFIIVLSLKGLRRGVRWAWYLLMLVPAYYLGQALIGWPIDAAFLPALVVLSGVAVALPYNYFTSSSEPHSEA